MTVTKAAAPAVRGVMASLSGGLANPVTRVLAPWLPGIFPTSALPRVPSASSATSLSTSSRSVSARPLQSATTPSSSHAARLRISPSVRPPFSSRNPAFLTTSARGAAALAGTWHSRTPLNNGINSLFELPVRALSSGTSGSNTREPELDQAIIEHNTIANEESFWLADPKILVEWLVSQRSLELSEAKNLIQSFLASPRRKDRYSGHERAIRGYVEIYPTLQLLHAAAKRPLRVLDIGGAAGVLASMIAALGHRVTVVEPSDLRMLGESFGKKILFPYVVAGGTLKFIDDRYPDLTTLGSEKFDLVISVNALQYVKPEERSAAIRRTASLLAPGGANVTVFMPRPFEGKTGEPLTAETIENAIKELNEKNGNNNTRVMMDSAVSGIWNVSIIGGRMALERLQFSPEQIEKVSKMEYHFEILENVLGKVKDTEIEKYFKVLKDWRDGLKEKGKEHIIPEAVKIFSGLMFIILQRIKEGSFQESAGNVVQNTLDTMAESLSFSDLFTENTKNFRKLLNLMSEPSAGRGR